MCGKEQLEVFLESLFLLENKVSVKFCDDLGTAEGAVDQGGPKREFFTLVLDAIMNSQIFCGSENSKFLSCSASCQSNDYYFFAGEVIAMSLVHGGPGFRCMAPVGVWHHIVVMVPYTIKILFVYDSIVYGTRSVSVDINDVYDFELKTQLVRLINCKSVEEARSLINDQAIENILDLAGTLELIKSLEDVIRIVYNTAHWYLLDRVNCSLERFKEGSFTSLFIIFRSDKGSNKYQKESQVLSYWNDYLQDIDDGAGVVTFNDILFFSSGCKELPPLGLKLSIRFLHTPESDGSMSQFPKANTCACILLLPTIHAEFMQFKEALTTAFLNAKGFGEP